MMSFTSSSPWLSSSLLLLCTRTQGENERATTWAGKAQWTRLLRDVLFRLQFMLEPLLLFSHCPWHTFRKNCKLCLFINEWYEAKWNKKMKRSIFLRIKKMELVSKQYRARCHEQSKTSFKLLSSVVAPHDPRTHTKSWASPLMRLSKYAFEPLSQLLSLSAARKFSARTYATQCKGSEGRRKQRNTLYFILFIFILFSVRLSFCFLLANVCEVEKKFE